LIAEKMHKHIELKNLFRKWDVIKQCLPILHIEEHDIKPKKPFYCVIPGHAKKKNTKSACILPPIKKNHVFVYADFHSSPPKNFFLPEVYMMQKYHERNIPVPKKVNKPEFTIWAMRLLVDAGILIPYPINAPRLPMDAPQHIKQMYEGFLLLLSIRWLYDKHVPAPFAWNFGKVWCDVSHRQMAEAFKWLLGKGYLIKKQDYSCPGRGKKVGLFLPGTKELVEERREHAQKTPILLNQKGEKPCEFYV
jgi:hypothetical protein